MPAEDAAGAVDSTPGLGRSPGEGNGSLLQYSCLENSRDRGAWGLQSMGLQKESDMTEQLNIHTHMHACTTLWEDLVIHASQLSLLEEELEVLCV